jgi:PEP-CTERM motif
MRHRHPWLVVLLSSVISLAAARSAEADFITSLSVNVSPTGGIFQYDYTLMNSTQSTVSAYVFALAVDPAANLQSIGTPIGWDSTYNVGDTSITWSAPSDQLALEPGFSAFFAFTSVDPPLTRNYDVTGFDPDQFQFYDNPGTTWAPGISSVPEPSALILLGIGSLALIVHYLSWNSNRWCRRGRCHRGIRV